MIIGQGDVTLIRVGPARRTGQRRRDLTVAIGEESGHSHVLRLGVDLGVIEGKHLIDVPQATQIDVAGMPWRHTALDLAPGLYELIDHQIEYTPAAIVRSED